MKIFVMRHGQAEDFAETDQLRNLTEVGDLETRVIAKYLSKEHSGFDLMLVSPFARAQQTAATLTEAMMLPVQKQTLDFLTPTASALEVHDYLDGILALEKYQSVLIVSHMPLVSYLVSELTVSGDTPIFQTAAVAEIDYDVKRMKGQLVRMINTESLC